MRAQTYPHKKDRQKTNNNKQTNIHRHTSKQAKNQPASQPAKQPASEPSHANGRAGGPPQLGPKHEPVQPPGVGPCLHAGDESLYLAASPHSVKSLRCCKNINKGSQQGSKVAEKG